ncbi:MAG TPA: acetylxylan esterase [Fimbriimonas sp.]
MNPAEAHLPEDFGEFWQQILTEADAVRLDYHRSNTNDYNLPGFIVERISFGVSSDRRLNGWLAYPEGARRLPGFVWIPPYGRESLLPNAYGTREGFASLSFNFFGYDAFHQEKYEVERGYCGEGTGDKETWVFRSMVQDALVATRVLQAQVEVDEDRIGAMGMSQGGGMAIWLGAASPIVRAVCADMPFLGAIQDSLRGAVHRYPLKELTDAMERMPLGRERVLNTVSYFDTRSVATRCMKPTQVSRGLKDPAVKPHTAQAVFEALPGAKRLITYDWGHDWHPDMVENNRQWLLENLR